VSVRSGAAGAAPPGRRILLVGIPRCGSTWVANVLGRAGETRVVYEPEGHRSDILGVVLAPRLGQFPVLEPDDDARSYRRVWDLAFAGGWPWDRVSTARAAGRSLVRVPPAVRDRGVLALAVAVTRLRPRPRHVVVKSVNAALAMEWVTERYAPAVVVLHRSPLNVVSSWLALSRPVDHQLASNRTVQRLYIEPYGLPALAATASPLVRTTWTVALLMTALRLGCERHPDWVVASHDELCVEPGEGFAALYETLGLGWTEATDAYLSVSESPDYTVHGGSPRVHPNALTATEPSRSRREQQATQYLRRMSAPQVAEASAVLADFPLGDWGGAA
jgi:hypothetical protein